MIADTVAARLVREQIEMLIMGALMDAGLGGNELVYQTLEQMAWRLRFTLGCPHYTPDHNYLTQRVLEDFTPEELAQLRSRTAPILAAK